MDVTNNSKAPQGLHTAHGIRYLMPGDTKELVLTKSQYLQASRLDFLTLEGEPIDDVAIPETAGGKDEGIYIPSREFNAKRTAFEKQAEDMQALRTENDGLRQQLADATAGKSSDGPKGPFEVKENAPGWFGIFGADGQQIGKNIREADAETFKGMTPEEQKAYLSE